MTVYNEAYKEQVIQKVLLAPKRSIRVIAEETNISYSTLKTWVREHKKINDMKETAAKRTQDWTLEERFRVIIETSHLDEEAIGRYCREKGMYQEQLERWKSEFMQIPGHTRENKLKGEIKLLRGENKALKKDLERKNKALAETSALLILKKKADLIWGVNEAD